MEVSGKRLVEYENLEFVSRLNDFSEEIILNLFAFMSVDELINCSLVQKKWERCSGEKVLWKLWTKMDEMDNNGHKKKFKSIFAHYSPLQTVYYRLFFVSSNLNSKT
ncbi:MAG: F-box protein [Parachlamydiaceae bacterium]|nr:F-box protein [Parachlamydiaceae bacterium]